MSPGIVAQSSTVGMAQPGPTPARFFKVPPAEAASLRTAAARPVAAPAAPADRSVVEAPVEPDCEYKDPVSDPASAGEIRIKLDYEQQCHRQSAMILRMRLQQLQEVLIGASTSQSEPEPDCAFKGSLSNPATAEQIRTKLQYELQCYRRAELEVRARIRQLQSSTTGRK
jgi:hypothetical protein